MEAITTVRADASSMLKPLRGQSARGRWRRTLCAPSWRGQSPPQADPVQLGQLQTPRQAPRGQKLPGSTGRVAPPPAEQGAGPQGRPPPPAPRRTLPGRCDGGQVLPHRLDDSPAPDPQADADPRASVEQQPDGSRHPGGHVARLVDQVERDQRPYGVAGRGGRAELEGQGLRATRAPAPASDPPAPAAPTDLTSLPP